MCYLLKRMGFIVDNYPAESPEFIKERTLLFNMWVVLKGYKLSEGGISIINLLTFLLAIQGINYESSKSKIQK